MPSRPTIGVAYDFPITLFAPDGSGPVVDPVIVLGDAKISINYQAAVNLNTTPAKIAAGQSTVRVDLANTEMLEGSLLVLLQDQTDPAEWLPVSLVIQPQHPIVTTDDLVTAVSGNASGATVALNSFSADDRSEPTGFWNDAEVLFTSGNNNGFTSRVESYTTGTPAVFVIDPPALYNIDTAGYKLMPSTTKSLRKTAAGHWIGDGTTADLLRTEEFDAQP